MLNIGAVLLLLIGVADGFPPCNLPTTVENADIIEKKQEVYNHGETVTYECRTNYRMEGERTITCQSGQWSPGTPTCIVIPPCNLPTRVENADIIEKKQEVYNHGETVTYECRTNYRMEGWRTITCQSGQWIPGTPTCIVIPPCNLTTTVENADIIEKKQEVYNHGETVTYPCRTNYRMEGERTITCRSGQWSPRTPVCIGEETCVATQPHITTQCFGSLGGTVEVLLPTMTSQDDTYRLKINHYTILSDRRQTHIRYSFNVSTGIFAIKDINWSDNGTYSMEVHDQFGREVAHTKCYLTIQVPGLIPFIARSLTVVLLLLAALGVYWALKKKKTSRPRDIALSSMAVDDDVLYGNVSGATGRAGGE
ncbi:complement factor H-like [Gadus chalcogrammus]|uniref:complement factor H-like n=1 Tax=Gadus chalcogrammus TaxID=1042646 RepID=UPI0024C49FB1|nr:complement factor H-like [Gadus chalcogrammus]XP_056456306.1 complement factor H-like [Gadus chalcogrammus]